MCFWKPGTFPMLGDSSPELKRHYPRYQFASLLVDMDFCFPIKTNILKPLKFIAICVMFLLTESLVRSCLYTYSLPLCFWHFCISFLQYVWQSNAVYICCDPPQQPLYRTECLLVQVKNYQRALGSMNLSPKPLKKHYFHVKCWCCQLFVTASWIQRLHFHIWCL
jgi:hypothetical protein